LFTEREGFQGGVEVWGCNGPNFNDSKGLLPLDEKVNFPSFEPKVLSKHLKPVATEILSGEKFTQSADSYPSPTSLSHFDMGKIIVEPVAGLCALRHGVLPSKYIADA